MRVLSSFQVALVDQAEREALTTRVDQLRRAGSSPARCHHPDVVDEATALDRPAQARSRRAPSAPVGGENKFLLAREVNFFIITFLYV